MPELWQQFNFTWLRRATLMLAAALICAGCETGVKTSDRNLSIMHYEELTALLEAGRTRPLLIDVRKPQEYAKGHIPGAVNIPVLDLQPNDPRLGEATHIVVYSDGWTPRRNDRLSWAAAKKLLAMGYVGIHDYRGGIDSWTRHGRSLISPESEESAEAES